MVLCVDKNNWNGDLCKHWNVGSLFNDLGIILYINKESHCCSYCNFKVMLS